jgi:hypothetical protein
METQMFTVTDLLYTAAISLMAGAALGLASLAFWEQLTNRSAR